MHQGYVVVVPVKPPARGKSRLLGLTDERRRDLAAALALDTIGACLAATQVAQVLVATDDASFSSDLLALGCSAIPDGDTTDLNSALRQAAAEARRRWPELVAVAVCADLPALRPTELDAALVQITLDGPCFVADADGIGTTMYAAAYDAFCPRFGAASRASHLQAGATEIGAGLLSLRRDVDDLDALRDAASLGLGPRTTELVAILGLS